MTYKEAIAALDAQWAAGDMDADEYEYELTALAYAYGAALNNADERQGVAS